jgi:tRNA pseudouridine38-40 synthase
MVGTLILVGREKWTPKRVKEALEAKDRRVGGTRAPAEGLYFTSVFYE